MDIPADTLDTLRDIAEQQQRLQRQQQLILQTLLDAKGLDPQEHRVDLESGEIVKAE
jgi:hypothetical protein